MSLFGSAGSGGSIWSKTGLFYSQENRINDILARDSYTLDELLDEDEMLQEVKQENEQLIEL